MHYDSFTEFLLVDFGSFMGAYMVVMLPMVLLWHYAMYLADIKPTPVYQLFRVGYLIATAIAASAAAYQFHNYFVLKYFGWVCS